MIHMYGVQNLRSIHTTGTPYSVRLGKVSNSTGFRTLDRLHYPGRAIPEGPGNGHNT
jgi:hypothetical protein